MFVLIRYIEERGIYRANHLDIVHKPITQDLVEDLARSPSLVQNLFPPQLDRGALAVRNCIWRPLKVFMGEKSQPYIASCSSYT